MHPLEVPRGAHDPQYPVDSIFPSIPALSLPSPCNVLYPHQYIVIDRSHSLCVPPRVLPSATIVPLHYIASFYPTGHTMPLRDIPPELEDAFLNLAAEASSPATTTEHLRSQIITLVGCLGAIPTVHPPVTPPDQIQQLEHEVAVLQEDLDRERETIGNLNRTIRIFGRERPTAATQAQEYREKIPDPDKYDGDRDTLPEFLLQLRLKAPTFRDDQARLRYAISLLKGKALT